MIVKHFCPMWQGRCSDRRGNGIQYCPQRLKYFSCYDAGPWNERRSIAKKAFIFVAMNMQKPNGLVNGQSGWKMGTNTFPKIDNVLADNVVNEHDSLLGVHSSDLQCLKKSKVD